MANSHIAGGLPEGRGGCPSEPAACAPTEQRPGGRGGTQRRCRMARRASSVEHPTRLRAPLLKARWRETRQGM